MNKNVKSIVFWAPRIISVAFILFVSMFAFDAFDSADVWWKVALGFLIHLIPSFLLIIGLVIAWRYEWVGALAFVAFGLWYLIGFTDKHWATLLLLSGIPILVGAIWWFGWLERKKK